MKGCLNCGKEIYGEYDSFDYQEKINTHTWPWSCRNSNPKNLESIKSLEKELSGIPYEFERPISDLRVGELMKAIQQADRSSKFAIGGLAQYVINYLMESRRNNRKKRKIERMGIIAQRYDKNIIKT